MAVYAVRLSVGRAVIVRRAADETGPDLLGSQHPVRNPPSDHHRDRGRAANPKSAFRRNLRGRAATHLATGRTEAGRRLTVAFIYLSATRTAVPISAWENR